MGREPECVGERAQANTCRQIPQESSYLEKNDVNGSVSHMSNFCTESRLKLHSMRQLKLIENPTVLLEEPEDRFGTTTAPGKGGGNLRREAVRESHKIRCKNCPNLWLTHEPCLEAQLKVKELILDICCHLKDRICILNLMRLIVWKNRNINFFRGV